jgi:zinc D-Ala-D-Ala carboxypeptidase
MAITLSGSVGAGGSNKRVDTMLVQAILNETAASDGGPTTPLTMDALVGPKTIQAIETFQKHHILTSDGRIDVGGKTLARLNQVAAFPPLTELAQRVMDESRITLAKAHSSGKKDDANAKQNIVDTAAGNPAQRSAYKDGNLQAPGGTVELHPKVLLILLTLARHYTFEVSEIAGAAHHRNSRHYDGIAFDVNHIDGAHVAATHPDLANFMQWCRDLGCNEVLGPGDAGHSGHIHGALPR